MFDSAIRMAWPRWVISARPAATVGTMAGESPNGRIANLTVESVERGDSRTVEQGLLAGVTLFALAGAVLTLAFTGAGVAVGTFLLPRFGPESRLDFAALLPILPLVGAASIFSCSRTERTAPAFYLTMMTVFAATLFFRWVG